MKPRTPDSIDVHVGSYIRLRRRMLGLTQGKLANHLGVSFQQVQKYENGVNRVGASRLQKIADFLKVPVSFFFLDHEGMGEAKSASETRNMQEAVEFFAFPDSVQLNQAFVRVKDQKVRQKIVALVKTLADDETA